MILRILNTICFTIGALMEPPIESPMVMTFVFCLQFCLDTLTCSIWHEKKVRIVETILDIGQGKLNLPPALMLHQWFNLRFW